MKHDEYESATTWKILRFLEDLIHQPKEWISGAKLKLSEMKFPGEHDRRGKTCVERSTDVVHRNGHDIDE
jgi:hypothetical protein